MRYLLILLLACTANAANWYVKPAGGTGAGTDWTTAWSITKLNSTWSSVNAGDTIWFAGGSYTTTITPQKSGSAGNPIYLKRVLSTDAVPASASGWSAAFDAVVELHPANATGINFKDYDAGSYLAFDGRTNYGWKVITDDWSAESSGAVCFNRGASGPGNVTFNCMDFGGPNDARDHFFVNNQGVVCFPYGGGHDVTFSNCVIHGSVCLVFLRQSSNITFDHCLFRDCDRGGASNDAQHPNVIDFWGTTGAVFRYCEFTRWVVECFMLWGTDNELTVHGCVFHDAIDGKIENQSDAATCFWPTWRGGDYPTTYYPRKLTLYNNTFKNVIVTSSQGTGTDQDKPFSADSIVRNNLYTNAAWYAGSYVTNTDYEFSTGTARGANSISSGSAPFTSGYAISTNISASLPRNKGATLTGAYAADAAGNTRGADGAWDIGAYEAIVTGVTNAPATGGGPALLLFTRGL